MTSVAFPISSRAAFASRLRAALPLAGVVLQLVLALFVIRQFQLESRTFFKVATLMAGGFVVHAVLPLRLRLPFFALLSATSVGLAFGVRDGSLILLVGTVLVGLCHLPVRWGARVALVIAVGFVLALLRANVFDGALAADAFLSPGAWAILGSMFMFRLALYMYALRTSGPDDPPITAARTFAYFFMAPNVSFPLFPVIDYATFAKNYFDRPAVEIYQVGMRWMARGLVQLILYRLVYTHLANDPTQLRSAGDLLQYLLATYLLYLRVSGSFHLIVGMLCLFGFRLPETHHLFYLASSFNDYWRRINIYWKDFMMKLVYYPSFFRLRRFGAVPAMVWATAIVFIATWVLHSYQWFWLRGGVLLTWPDTLFWAILGALVVHNALRETKRGRVRTRTLGTHAPRWTWTLAWKTFGTFTAICLLWSFWSAESIAGYFSMFAVLGTAGLRELATFAVLVGAGLAVSGYPWGSRHAVASERRSWLLRDPVPTMALLAVVLIIGSPAAYERLGPRVAAFVISLQRSTLNARDIAQQHKGYYEKLDNIGRADSQLWDVTARVPADWTNVSHSRAYHRRRGLLRAELLPNMRVPILRVPLSTNRWGMRDQHYDLAKPTGTRRIAMLGASHVMGSGVPDGEAFEAVLERDLNESSTGDSASYEVLNFGVGSYSLLDQVATLDEKVFRFSPDVVVITVDQMMNDWVSDHLLGLARRGVEMPYPELQALVQRAGLAGMGAAGAAGPSVPFAWLRAGLGAVGVETSMPWREQELRMQRIQDDVAVWAIRHIARRAREHGALPVLLALDVVTGRPPVDMLVMRSARAEGVPVLDLFDVYGGHSLESLRLAPWDDHPNVAGHRLIAARLLTELTRPGAIPVLTAAP